MHQVMQSAVVAPALPQAIHIRKTAPARLQPPRHVGIGYLVRQLVTSLPLVAADGLSLVVTGLLVTRIPWLVTSEFSLQLLPFLGAPILVVYALTGLYPAIGLNSVAELKRCSISTTSVFVTAVAVFLASVGLTVGDAIAITLTWLLMLLTVPLARSATRNLAYRFDFWAQPVLIVGGITEGAKIYHEIQSSRRSGLRPLGIIAENTSQWLEADSDADLCIGTADEAASIARRHGAYWAVVVSRNGKSNGEVHPIEECLAGIPHQLYINESQLRNGSNNEFEKPVHFDS